MKKLSQVEQENIVGLLMEALSDEWKAMLQYQIHASRMRGLHGGGIAEHLEEHAEDERAHAERLTKHFYSHDLPIEINIPQFNPGNDTIEMIQLDLEGEIEAIDRYTKIAELCEDIPELTDTRILIEDILIDEVEHQDENASFIKAKIEEKTDNFSGTERVSLASSLIKAADVVDVLGLEEFADRYTKIAAEI